MHFDVHVLTTSWFGISCNETSNYFGHEDIGLQCKVCIGYKWNQRTHGCIIVQYLMTWISAILINWKKKHVLFYLHTCVTRLCENRRYISNHKEPCCMKQSSRRWCYFSLVIFGSWLPWLCHIWIKRCDSVLQTAVYTCTR